MREVIRLEHTFVCDKDWDELTGTGKERHCAQCDRHLHNLSLYTEREAHKLATQLLKEESFCAVFELEGDRILFKQEAPSRIPRAVGVAALAIPLLAACDERSEVKPQAVSAQSEVVAQDSPSTPPEPGAAALTRDEVVNCSDEELSNLKAKVSAERSARMAEARSQLFEILEGGEVVEAALEPTILEGNASTVETIMERRRHHHRRLMGRIQPPD